MARRMRQTRFQQVRQMATAACNMPLTSEQLAALRRDYSERGLRRAELSPDPITQFQAWLHEAHAAELLEPNAMTLATVDGEGHPWTRSVLLKICDHGGFSFFTNYSGAKATHLDNEPRAALTFWWGGMERQVNVTGRVEKVSAAESDAYFISRPVASRLGAWASQQSSVLSNREELEERFAAARERFPDDNIPRPENWGGYRLVPSTIEFWQGRRSRLHDRLRFRREPGADWTVERLAP
jgi:pyridoxamine 5'-phosphate oxidase